MQKALAILEQQVQWLALVLAGVFLLFCVWGYVFTPPAVVTLGPKKETVGPSDVDEITKNGPVREIDASIKGTTTEQASIVVPDVVNPWKAQMDGTGIKIAMLPETYPNSPPAKIGISATIAEAGNNAKVVVAALPELPKAQPQAPEAGLSVVTMPPTQGANGAQAQAVANTTWDQHWATASFIVPAAELKAALDKVLAGKVGNLPLTTDVLHVELQRQRGTMTSGGPVFPNGEVGVETVAVPKLLQGILKPLPDSKATIPEKASYADWAEKSVEAICQPKFYDVKGGTAWTAPTLGQNPATAAAAPAAPKGLAGIPLAIPQKLGGNGAPNAGPGLPGGAAGGPGGNSAMGQINPNNVTQDILLWAHDDTVMPGQVYRYRVVYYMKNPVLGYSGIGAPNIVDILPVKSPPSDWSAPVTVPQSTKFFFASVRGNTAMADVFHWESGTWTKHASPVSPGDRLGDSDRRVVDVHGSSPQSRERDKYVVLVNDAGEVARRYPGTDTSNEEYKALKAEVNPGAGTGAGNGSSTPAPARGTPARTSPAGRTVGAMPR